jgi:hypothetical protein
MEGLQRTLRWTTAIVLVGSLYAHTLFNSDRAGTTTTVAFIIAGLLALSTALWIARPSFIPPATLARRWGLILGAAAILICVVISFFHLLNGEMTTKDFGQFGIYCGVPIFLFLNSDRVMLADTVAFICVLAALADLVFNLGVIFDLVQPVVVTTFEFNGQSVNRYPGISGSVLGAGLVGLVASIYVAARVRLADSRRALLFWLVVLMAIFLGLVLVGSRRYLVEAIVGVFVLLLGLPNSLTLPLVGPAIGAFGLYETFHNFDVGNRVRQTLMRAGWEDLQAHFWTGAGILYREQALNVTMSFGSLWKERVTESGFLDLGLAFGLPATVLLMLAVTVTMGARRNYSSWYAVIVAVMLGEFAYGLPLGGFLGSVVFYCALLVVVLDERPTFDEARKRRRVRYQRYASA